MTSMAPHEQKKLSIKLEIKICFLSFFIDNNGLPLLISWLLLYSSDVSHFLRPRLYFYKSVAPIHFNAVTANFLVFSQSV